MKKILLVSLLFSLSLSANCKSLYFLGLQDQSLEQEVTSKNSLVWRYSKSKWRVSSLQDKIDLNSLTCKEKAYVLINNDDISYETPAYTEATYSLKRGWNYVHSHKDGVDIEKSFENTFGVEFVYVYDRPTHAWAAYSPQKHNQDIIFNTRVLRLKKIEPNRGFFVYATRNVTINIQSTPQTGICKTLMSDKNYASLTDSGADSDTQYNANKSIGLKSRYFSHYKRGIYSESRITLIYPKLKQENKFAFKYGPAVPKSMIEYAKEYENLNFYMFDHKENKCYQGTFPSMKRPPLASLKEMK